MKDVLTETIGRNNPAVGRRSRTIARRRTRKQRLEKLTKAIAERELITLEFGRMAAEFADSHAYAGSGAANAIEWMTENLHMTAEDAADSITIGRHMIQQFARRSDQAQDRGVEVIGSATA